MICKECQAEGLKSTISEGPSMSTLMHSPPHYDTEGKYHNHDANTHTHSLACSNGHKWTKVSYNHCWCGWTNEPPEVENASDNIQENVN